MKRRIAILFYFLFLFTTAFGSDLDSLLRCLKTAKEDTNKVLLLNQIGELYEGNNYDSAIWYYNTSRKISKNLKYDLGEIKYYSNITAVYNQLGKFDTALLLNFKCLAYAKKMNYLPSIAISYGNIGASYNNLTKYDSAIFYNLKAEKIFVQLQDDRKLSVLYSNICALYNALNQYQLSLQYGYKSISILEKKTISPNLCIAYINIGNTFSSLFKMDSAIYFYDKGYKVAEKLNHRYAMTVTTGNIFDIKMKTGKYDELFELSDRYVVLSKDLGSTELNAVAMITKTYANYYNNKAEEAKKYGLEALKLSLENELPDQTRQSYNALAKIEARLGNYRQADLYDKKQDSINQIQTDDEIIKNIQDLETKYETQKKENEILKQQQQLKKRNNWIFFLVSSIAILLLLSFLFYRYFKQRNTILENEKTIQQQKIIDLEKEKQLQATESILKGQEEERSRIAKDLHDGLGGLLSGVKYSLNNMKENVILSSENALSFERTVDMLDSGIQELRRVAHNMMPENLLKFGLDTALKDYITSISNTGKLQINYSSFGMENFSAETNVSITVYRIVQELINNTMKHAEATQSIVQIANENNVLHITVEDNGKGFDAENITNFKGAGWTNIQNRTTYLKGKMNVDSSAQNGTSITIEIPLLV